ncbi:dipeptidase 1 (renal) [Mactra antiquata]
MDDPAVYYSNTGGEKQDATAVSVRSTTELFASDSQKKMNTRVVYGSLAALVIALIAVLIALIVVATSKNSNETSSSGSSAQGSCEDSNSYPWVVPDCSYAKTNLEKAHCVLDSYPLVDGHNDLPYRYRMFANNSVYNVDLTSDLRLTWDPNVSHTDIPKMRKGKLGAQFWADYVPCASNYKDAVRLSLEQLDVIKKYVARYPETFEFVTTAQGILDAFKDGKIGSLIGLEGGHSIDSSLGTLRMFYTLGVRYMTVTHSCNVPWADNWLADTPDYNETLEGPKHDGLTAFGEKVILEMNRLGMLVDLSHVAKATMEDALRISKAPVIYSHSSAFEYCNHYRNVQDSVLRLTKENGGVVMVNFYDKYINCEPNLKDTPTLSQVADHIEYIKNLIGVDYVGIGADYDGVPSVPVGLEDTSTYPALFAELIKRGWNEENLQKLAGRNLIRVFKQAEKVSDEMGHLPPYEDIQPQKVSNPDDLPCRTDF